VQLQKRQPDGATLRTHLQRLASNTGRVDPLLIEDPPPPYTRALTEAYASMSASRRSGMGRSSLTVVDIEAWCRLFNARLSPWELETIIQMDAAALAAADKTD